MEILKAFLLMVILGAVIGLFLGIAGNKLAVKEDTRLADLLAMLPGYNCGGCGNPGCSGMAEALVSGKSHIEDCKPCKPDQRTKIKEYMKEHDLAA